MNSILTNDNQDDSAAQFQGNELDPAPPSPTPAAKEPEDTTSVVLSAERLDEALAEGVTNIGTYSVVLPDPATQAVGFSLPKVEAAVFVAQFRQYKFLVKKGQATPSVTI